MIWTLYGAGSIATRPSAQYRQKVLAVTMTAASGEFEAGESGVPLRVAENKFPVVWIFVAAHQWSMSTSHGAGPWKTCGSLASLQFFSIAARIFTRPALEKFTCLRKMKRIT